MNMNVVWSETRSDEHTEFRSKMTDPGPAIMASQSNPEGKISLEVG